MLATLSRGIPTCEEWVHEVKEDGYRAQLIISGTQARVITRNGVDWTRRFPTITTAARKLPCRTAIIDGEIIVRNEKGVSDFGALPSAISLAPADLRFVGFDLLEIDGQDLRIEPFWRRRSELETLLCEPSCSALEIVQRVRGDAESLAKLEIEGREGVVSKLRQSPYISGRSREWRKTKFFTEERFTLRGLQPRAKGMTALLKSKAGAEVGAAMITEPFLRSSRLADYARAYFAAALPSGDPPRAAVQLLSPGLDVMVRYLRGSDKLRHAHVIGLCGQHPPGSQVPVSADF